MLKMNCPNCHKQITSSLLAELDKIFCQHCHSGVPVRNVLISARGMTINRDDMLQRFHRYRKLLTDIREERNMMEENSGKGRLNKKGADDFIETLEELMAGARDNYRLQFSLTVPVRFVFSDKEQYGWLVNLSMVGACVEIEDAYFQPPVGEVVQLEMEMPGKSSQKLSQQAMVAWVADGDDSSRPTLDIGLKFVEMGERFRNDLWHLIAASVQDAMTESQLTG